MSVTEQLLLPGKDRLRNMSNRALNSAQSVSYRIWWQASSKHHGYWGCRGFSTQHRLPGTVLCMQL